MRQALILLLASFAVTTAINCNGTSDTFNEWCMDSCNNDPPVCPRTLCTCENDTMPETNCQAVGVFQNIPGADEWCSLNCNSDPSFCPSGYCLCRNSSVPVPDFAVYSEHEPTCCDNESRFQFYSEAGKIWKRATTDAAGEKGELCYEIDGGNPTSLIVDQDNMLWVADPILGVVLKMSTTCDPASVVVVQSWARDQFIDKPFALAFVEGALIVSGSTNLFYITFTMSGEVYDVGLIDTQLANDIGGFFVRDIEVTQAGIFFISRDARVLFRDILGGNMTVLDFHDYNIVDYGGITVNDCGLYFTDSDSNQIWFCPEADPTQCRVYCAQDPELGSPTCVNTNNPTSIESGCCCDIYVSNPGNGCLTVIRDDGFTNQTAQLVPEIITCNLTHPNAFTFWVAPGSAPGCAQECNPDPATPSASPSPSPSTLPRTTGRLVPGINMQFAGGVTQAAVLTGAATLLLVRCPPGVDLTGLTAQEIDTSCPSLSGTSWRIPITHLNIVNQEGDASRMESFAPFLTAVSASPTQQVCLLHSEIIINRGGSIEQCDDACFQAGEGVANDILCTQTGVDVAGARQRARDGASEILGTTVSSTDLPEGIFQSASNSLCDGESMAEFSINLMANTAGVPITLNVVSQPRFDFADRCNDTPAEVAPRVCYKTSEFPNSTSLHGVFGDENDFVCVNEFVLPDGNSGFFEFDQNLEQLQGDIMDTSFGLSGRPTGCISTFNANPLLTPLCFLGSNIQNRICLTDNCP